MPYESEAQRRKFHALLAQGKINPATVAEFDKASEGLSLPRYKKAAKGRKPPTIHERNVAKRREFFGG